MKFISLFAGVGGFDLGMERAGHECVAQVEWDKNAAGVLKRRWPDVPLFCDVSKVRGEDLPECDFITYGFPCQDLSVAGKREGLSGKRSGLFYEATRIFREILDRGSVRPDGTGGTRLRLAIAENVPGVFSADDGLAFARCIGELLESGACEVGWRILNSEYFGVAQRRRRVFIVSDFGGESCDEVLAITESLPGYNPPKRKTGESSPRNAQEGVGDGEQGSGTLRSQGGAVYPEVSGSLSQRDYKGPGGVFNGEPQGIVATASTMYEGKPVSEAISNAVCSKWAKGSGGPAGSETGNMVVESLAQGADVYNGELTGETAPTLTSATGISNASGPKVMEEKNLTVRRLTPIECERLQGFPDGWTSERMEVVLDGNEWKATGKIVKQADGPRYRQQGNAVTVPVAEWIGKQIAKAIKA
tara:strand:- start:528 stop:1778 length:1251 start_codon:yes stop_codon:yes gene_type:complete